MIVTGGETTPSKVSVYNAAYGFLEDLPPLKNGRYYHACGHYIDTNDMLVSLLQKIYLEKLLSKYLHGYCVCYQVYLVTGGYYQSYLSSTELLTEGSSSWVAAGSLPSGREGLRGVTINNKIFVTGDRVEKESSFNKYYYL